MLLFGVGTASAQPEELPLGSSLPAANGSLQVVGGGTTSVSELTGASGTVFLFWSNQCPWVDKYEGRVQDLIGSFSGQSIRFVLVNSNDASAFPKESAQASASVAQNFDATYVKDSGAALAQALGASRTPHAFVFDAQNTLVYAGTIDDSPGDPGAVSKTYLRDALSAVVNGEDVQVADTKAFGCTIKFPQ
jgi:hypothetical protein